MRFVRQHEFGDVVSYELGWAPIGKPMMNVFFYLVEDVMIDTGQRHMQSSIFDIVSNKTIQMVLLTHHHEDHSGNAAALKRRLGLPVLGHPLTVEKMKRRFKIFFYQHYIWGQAEPLAMDVLPKAIETDSFMLKPIHTPGHSKDHTVFLEPERGWLFSGDLYLADCIKYFRADEYIEGQIESLKKVLTLDFDALFCCHHPRPENGKEHLSNKLQFLEDLFGHTKALWENGLKENEIMRRLKLKETHLVKWFCFGNVSMRNMIRSVVRSLERGKRIVD